MRMSSGSTAGTNPVTIDTSGNLSATGNVSSGSTNGVQLDATGSIEIYRSDSVPFIDFKTTSAEDYDCRIQQQSDGLAFSTGGNGSTSERFRIASAGQIGIGGANYGTSGQVLTSGGSGAAPSWTTPTSVNSSQLAKAFVQWQGSNGTINCSYNVSSVTRNGTTGNYTVTFSTAFAGSYTIVLGGSRNNGRSDAFGLQYYGQSTTSVNIDTYLPAITYTDAYTADLVCFA